jgi:hypothetical protein
MYLQVAAFAVATAPSQVKPFDDSHADSSPNLSNVFLQLGQTCNGNQADCSPTGNFKSAIAVSSGPQSIRFVLGHTFDNPVCACLCTAALPCADADAELITDDLQLALPRHFAGEPLLRLRRGGRWADMLPGAGDRRQSGGGAVQCFRLQC